MGGWRVAPAAGVPSNTDWDGGKTKMRSLFASFGRRRPDVNTASLRGTLKVVVVVAAAFAMVLAVPSAGYAVHDVGLFELDGNTVDNSPPVGGSNAPYDWESVFDASGNQTLTSATEPRLLTAAF